MISLLTNPSYAHVKTSRDPYPLTSRMVSGLERPILRLLYIFDSPKIWGKRAGLVIDTERCPNSSYPGYQCEHP